MENCKIGFAFDTQCFMKSWKVRQVTEFLFKCCQQLSQIMVQFVLFGGIYIWYLSIEAPLSHKPCAWSPLSAIWSSITQNIFNHKIFSCAPNIFMPNRKNIFSPPMDQIIFSGQAIWDLNGQKLNKFSTNWCQQQWENPLKDLIILTFLTWQSWI